MTGGCFIKYKIKGKYYMYRESGGNRLINKSAFVCKDTSRDCFRHCCRANRMIKRDIGRRKKKEEGRKRKEGNGRMKDQEIEEKSEFKSGDCYYTRTSSFKK